MENKLAPSPINPELTWADGMMFAVAMIWGTGFSFLKAALAEIPPFAFNTLRFPLAVVLLWLAWKRRGLSKQSVRSDLWSLVAIGVLGYVGYQVFFISGVSRTSASNSSLILASVPVFVAAINGLRQTESLGWLAWLGVLLSIGGIVLIVRGDGGTIAISNQTFLGDLLVVGASIAWAFYIVAIAPYLARHAALSVTTVSLGAATLVLVLIGLPQTFATNWSEVTPLAWISVLYTGGLGVAGAYLLWNAGVKRLGGTRAAVYSNLVPVIAVTTAALTLNEKITALHILGGIAILIGIGLSRTRERS